MNHADRPDEPLIAPHVVQHPGPLVLALAGGGCSPRIYGQVAAPGCALHEVDWMRGAGPFTPPAAARRLADALTPRTAPTVLLGHSLGGVIALLTALARPSAVQALVISNTGPHTRDHGDNSLPERIRHQWTPQTRRAFLQACFAHEPPPALMRELERYLGELPAEALLEAVEGLRRIDLSHGLGELRCPVLIAHGELDRRRRVADAQRLAALIPGAELVLLPGGHTPMVDCAGAYNEALDTFLARHLRATQP
ncbi:alpha/beta hydrolase [Pigmentiphaga daeguensis]